MSTIKVQNIQHTGSSTNAIALASDGTCTANITNNLSNRNLIINGSCQIAQRSNLATAQTGYGAVDRYQLHSSGASRFTLSQNAGVGVQYGLPKALKFETTTADNSVAAGDYMYLCQKLEGFDVQSIQKGSSDAKQVTLQFWIKLAVTGTYVVQLFDTDNSRHVVANYTVSSTNWEKKTITFPADTTGAFANDNGGSLEIRWHFMGGSTYRGGTQQTTWGSIVAANMLEGMGNAVSSTGDNFITGMQLEVGSFSSDFEFKSYGQELALCERYYERIDHVSGSLAFAGGLAGFYNASEDIIIIRHFRVVKRASPTFEYSAFSDLDFEPHDNSVSGLTVSVADPKYIVLRTQSTTAETKGHACYLCIDQANGFIAFNSEL